ncbi:uncharacterized protein LOC132309894 [Cornus florida]|uniref:uncharacterized protein LOC132309894 n=1 Tax=Cornus florida TaxID=4283 RepID=UPI00289E2925|nr:uncharacterized protein LOC132309894 [Cornus florida]
MRFVEALGYFGDNHVVRLREFSKSLTDRAYHWYCNLEPDSINTWEQLKDRFLTKFFQAEKRVTTLSLTKETQEDNEDVLAFINRFNDRVGECFKSSNEMDLVDICIQGMLQIYKLHLVNLRIASFGELKIIARNLKDLKPVAAKYEPPKYDAPKFEAPKSSNRRPTPDGVVVLPTPRREPTLADRVHADFCVYHQSITYLTVNCWGLRRLFQRRVASGDLEVTPAKDVRRFQYPDHRVVVITYYNELAETHSGQNVDLSEWDVCPLVASAKPYSSPKTTLSFSNAGKQSQGAQNQPLYVLASIKGVEFKHAFLDNGSSINVMPLSTFRKAGILKDRLVKEPIEVAGFGNDLRRMMGYVNVDLAVNKFQASTKFYVIDSNTSYHILLGRAWMHRFGIVPSTYHQCFKGIWNNKVVTVPCSDCLFATFEAHYTDALFFNDLDDCMQDCDATIISTPLPTWADAQKGIFHPPSLVQTSNAPRECKHVRFPNGRVIYRL